MNPLYQKLKTIAKHYKGPTLVYDLNFIRTRMIFLRDLCVENNITPLFTVKSFPFKPVLALAHEIMPGFEISNLSEYALLPKDLSGKCLSINDPTQQLGLTIPIPEQTDNHCYVHLDKLNEASTQIIKKRNVTTRTPAKQIFHSSPFG